MTSPLAIQLRKEVRELLPWWLGVAGLGLASALLGSWLPGAHGYQFALLAFGSIGVAAGTVALGANAFGDEYTNRTMASLLVLPVARTRLLALKLGVLFALVGALTLAMSRVLDGYARAEHLWRMPALTVAALALGVAPCLTLLFRSPLAGAAFAAATPLLFWIAGLWIPEWTGRDVESLVYQGSLFTSGAGLVMTCVLFLRLEAFDGPVANRRVPGWFRQTALHVPERSGSPARTQHPVFALLTKELRVQQMTLLISLFFVIAWVLTAFSRFVNPQPVHLGVIFPLTVIHGAFVTVMAGALAFAEERQLGTWQQQVLLPIQTGRQATVKVVVALVLALLQAIVLPIALNAIVPAPGAVEFDIEQVVGVFALCGAALYVSSASASGIRAVLTMLPFMVLVFLTGLLVSIVGRAGEMFFLSAGDVLPRIGWSYRTWREVTSGVLALLIVGHVLLMVGAACRNLATADRSHARYARQAVWLVLAALAAALVHALVRTIGNWSLSTWSGGS